MLIKRVCSEMDNRMFFSSLREFRDNIIKEIKQKKPEEHVGLIIQVLRPDLPVSKRLLKQVYINTIESFKNKTNRSEDLNNEFILWLACDDNFETAVKKVGVENTNDFLIVIINGDRENEKKNLKMEKEVFNKMRCQLKLKILKPEKNREVINEKNLLEKIAIHKLNRL